MKGKTRQANIELLRIVAMFMVVVLHYLVKGQAAVSLVENPGVLNHVLWLIKAFCIVTINVYVIISGYFLLEAQWKVSRVITLWLQTLVYSIGVPVVCLLLGMEEIKGWGMYDWINVIFPVQMEHYWFITAYVVMYLLVPVLSYGVKNISKKQHQWVIVGLLFLFCVPKTMLPFYIPTDRYGYDFGWFICLFLIASYLRLYEIPFINNIKRAITVYAVAAVGIWAISVVCAFLGRKGLPLAYMMDMAYCYNHLFVLIASVALFQTFRYIHIPEGKIAKIICGISPYTLGVYLLHENLALRTKWPFWVGIEAVRDRWSVIPHMILMVIAVFAAGVMVDIVRACLFQSIEKTYKKLFASKTAK